MTRHEESREVAAANVSKGGISKGKEIDNATGSTNVNQVQSALSTAAEESAKTFEALMDRAEELEAFAKIQCHAPNVECPNQVVVLTMVVSGDGLYTGGYCSEHLGLHSAAADLLPNLFKT